MIRRWWRCHQRWLMQIVVIDQTCNFVNAAPATNRQYHARCLIVLMSRIPTVCSLEANVLVDLPRKWSCQIWKQYSNMSARCQITLQRSAHSQEVASMSAAERRRYLFENWRKADTFFYSYLFCEVLAALDDRVAGDRRRLEEAEWGRSHLPDQQCKRIIIIDRKFRKMHHIHQGDRHLKDFLETRLDSLASNSLNLSLNLGGVGKKAGGLTVQGGGGGGGRGGGGGEAAALGIREQAIEKYLALIKDKRDLQRKNQKVAKPCKLFSLKKHWNIPELSNSLHQVQTRIAQHLRKHKIELSSSTPGKF